MSEIIFVLVLLWSILGLVVFSIVAEAMTADKPNFKFFIFSAICGPIAWLFALIICVFLIREWIEKHEGPIRQWARRIAKVIEK